MIGQKKTKTESVLGDVVIDEKEKLKAKAKKPVPPNAIIRKDEKASGASEATRKQTKTNGLSLLGAYK